MTSTLSTLSSASVSLSRRLRHLRGRFRAGNAVARNTMLPSSSQVGKATGSIAVTMATVCFLSNPRRSARSPIASARGSGLTVRRLAISPMTLSTRAVAFAQRWPTPDAHSRLASALAVSKVSFLSSNVRLAASAVASLASRASAWRPIVPYTTRSEPRTATEANARPETKLHSANLWCAYTADAAVPSASTGCSQ